MGCTCSSESKPSNRKEAYKAAGHDKLIYLQLIPQQDSLEPSGVFNTIKEYCKVRQKRYNKKNFIKQLITPAFFTNIDTKGDSDCYNQFVQQCIQAQYNEVPIREGRTELDQRIAHVRTDCLIEAFRTLTANSKIIVIGHGVIGKNVFYTQDNQPILLKHIARFIHVMLRGSGNNLNFTVTEPLCISLHVCRAAYNQHGYQLSQAALFHKFLYEQGLVSKINAKTRAMSTGAEGAVPRIAGLKINKLYNDHANKITGNHYSGLPPTEKRSFGTKVIFTTDPDGRCIAYTPSAQDRKQLVLYDNDLETLKYRINDSMASFYYDVWDRRRDLTEIPSSELLWLENGCKIVSDANTRDELIFLLNIHLNELAASRKFESSFISNLRDGLSQILPDLPNYATSSAVNPPDFSPRDSNI